MFSTICIILLFLLGVVFLVKHHVNIGPKYDQFRVPAWPIGIIFVVLSVLWAFLACTTIVQAKEVGVLTTFGKPSNRTLSSGLNWKAPWQKVTTIDGTIQTDKYRGDSCIYVRIGDGSRSCLTLTHRWQIVPERANETFANFRSNDPTESLRDAVVSTQLVSVAQDVLSEYNPIANLKIVDQEDTTSDLNFAPDYDELAQKITEGMEERYGDEPLVKTVAITVSYLSLSDSTQSKIDAFIAEVANTRIAVQRQQTAAAEAKANEALQENVSDLTLHSKCLDLIAEAQKTGYQFPAGFGCGDSSSAVVVPSAK